MLETLTLDATSTALDDAVPEVVIKGITFEDGKLWKARYPSLIDYLQVPPEYQMEPAIQITDTERSELTVSLSLAEGYVFQAADGDVKFQWVDGNGSPTPSCISAVLEDRRTCRVTWTREPAFPSTVALRFFCSPEKGPDPTDPESVNEGGVYLAFVVREEVWPPEVLQYLAEHPFSAPSSIAGERAAQQDIDRMKIGALLLPEGRIRYVDLFTQDAPEGAEFELAFRVQRSSVLGFDVGIVNPGFVFRENLENPEKVAHLITYPAESRVRPELETLFGEKEAICRVDWASEHPDDESGLTCSFNMIAQLDRGESSFRPVDPTIIEPPRCTNGICVG